MSDEVTLRIKSCRECPKFRIIDEQSDFAGLAARREFRCMEARHPITTEDGLRPPPAWCPLRTEDSQPPKETP